MASRRKISLWLLAVCLVFTLAQGSIAVESESGSNDTGAPQQVRLPFVFYNGTFGFSVGYIYGIAGFPQKQSGIMGSAMVGTSGSAMFFIFGKDIKLFGRPRFTLDPAISVGYFNELIYYVDGNLEHQNQRAGGHNSHVDDNVKGTGWENTLRLRFSYLLPIGYGRDHVTKNYKLERGLLKSGASGGESWNPFASGMTFIKIAPFYKMVRVEGDEIDKTDVKTNGADFGVYWDNRDYPSNPDRGFSIQFKFSRDFGGLGSTGTWTAYQFEFDKYFSLGSNGWLRQSTLAFDFWWAHSPSWEESSSGEILNNTPAFAGASLGGYWRLRGYPSSRFSDKAAIYYAMELRLMPKWNPFDSWGWLQKRLGVQWVQFVPFVEVGRVASKWELDELHHDMKVVAGLGVRANAKGMVLRLDTAFSDEDYSVQMMVAQPFQF